MPNRHTFFATLDGARNQRDERETLTETNAFILEYGASTDVATPVEGIGDILNHHLVIYASVRAQSGDRITSSGSTPSRA